MGKVFFVTGIDTDVGKSYVTGLVARYLKKRGDNVITQKLVQTGCEQFSEDIETHRKIMGVPNFKEDLDNTTAPVIFPFPSSPHLAAKLEGKEIDIRVIDNSTKILKERFDTVLLEGVGGVQVPITDNYTILDFLAERRYPVVP